MEWEIGCQYARALSQSVRFQTALDGLPGIRDSSMAENIRWILNVENPGSKMVVWAHNGHVATWAPEHTPSMGSCLRSMFGSKMVVVGFAFNQGSFRAIELPLPSQQGLHEFTLGPAPSGSLDSALASTGLSIAAIDLRTIPKAGPVADFFAQPRATRSIGGGFAYPLERSAIVSQEVPRLYDALIFVDSTTSTHLLKGGQRPPTKTLSEPTILDFEKVGADGEPTDWNIPSNLSNVDSQVSASAYKPHHGKYCAAIERGSGRHYGEACGSLYQQIDANEYRCKKLTIRAAVRIEGEKDSSKGHLWVSVARFGTALGDAGYQWTAVDPRITAGNWPCASGDRRGWSDKRPGGKTQEVAG
jgi:erythromycin esterase